MGRLNSRTNKAGEKNISELTRTREIIQSKQQRKNGLKKIKQSQGHMEYNKRFCHQSLMRKEERWS